MEKYNVSFEHTYVVKDRVNYCCCVSTGTEENFKYGFVFFDLDLNYARNLASINDIKNVAIDLYKNNMKKSKIPLDV